MVGVLEKGCEEDFEMIQISKEEALWFVKNTKAQWRNGISTSHSRNKKYYLVEKPDWIKKLKERRNAVTVSK